MVAARLAGGFNRWRKFDPQRQELMQSEMERIAGVDELSSDVREIISKSLQSPELASSLGSHEETEGLVSGTEDYGGRMHHS